MSPRAESEPLFRLESPTRTLTMEAPRGVEVSAAKGLLKVSGRKDLQLESTEGEVSKLDVRLFGARVYLCPLYQL